MQESQTKQRPGNAKRLRVKDIQCGKIANGIYRNALERRVSLTLPVHWPSFLTNDGPGASLDHYRVWLAGADGLNALTCFAQDALLREQSLWLQVAAFR